MKSVWVKTSNLNIYAVSGFRIIIDPDASEGKYCYLGLEILDSITGDWRIIYSKFIEVEKEEAIKSEKKFLKEVLNAILICLECANETIDLPLLFAEVEKSLKKE